MAFDPNASRRCCTKLSRAGDPRAALLPRAARSEIRPECLSAFRGRRARSDEIGGEVSASRIWWSTATRRWRVVDRQDAPAIRECLEQRWLHELNATVCVVLETRRRSVSCISAKARLHCVRSYGSRSWLKVDRAVLDFVKAHVFDPADFVIRIDGVCWLNPEMARMVVTRLWTEQSIARGQP